MTEKQMNDIFYVCSLIEYIARKTKNHRQDVIRCFSKKDIERQIYDAEVNHCLSFEQVSEELIDWFNIPDGNFDTVAECRYEVPSATSIGMLYQGLVLSTMKNDDAAQAIIDVFSSFITDFRLQFQCLLYQPRLSALLLSGGQDACLTELFFYADCQKQSAFLFP